MFAKKKAVFDGCIALDLAGVSVRNGIAIKWFNSAGFTQSAGIASAWGIFQLTRKSDRIGKKLPLFAVYLAGIVLPRPLRYEKEGARADVQTHTFLLEKCMPIPGLGKVRQLAKIPSGNWKKP